MKNTKIELSEKELTNVTGGEGESGCPKNFSHPYGDCTYISCPYQDTVNRHCNLFKKNIPLYMRPPEDQ